MKSINKIRWDEVNEAYKVWKPHREARRYENPYLLEALAQGLLGLDASAANF